MRSTATSGQSPESVRILMEKLKKHVLRGDYRGGLKVARVALRRHPDDPDCRFQYAKLLGDWADELPATRKRRYKSEAIRILKPLIRAMSKRHPEERFPVSLNYFYQSEDFAGMYRFGKRFARKHGRRGYYAQGIGAAYRAFELLKKNRGAYAVTWAEKAVTAWRRFDLKKEPYYFPHYSMAMALAITGRSRKALDRLKKSAQLSRRPVSDWEFADVLELIQQSGTSPNHR